MRGCDDLDVIEAGCARTVGRRHFDLPSPPQGVPWLVYTAEGIDRDRQRFFSIVDERVEVRNNYHFRHSKCLATGYGWMLLENFASQKVYLFNPSSSQRCPLPRLIDEKPDVFLLASDPAKDDCSVVGVYLEGHPHFLYTSPRENSWRKHELNFGDDSATSAIAVTSNGKGKVYLMISMHAIAVIQLSPLLIVQYFNTKHEDKFKLWRTNGHMCNIVASSEDLFYVETFPYDNTETNLLRTVLVLKLDFSSMTWVHAQTLDESVFFINRDLSFSIPLSNPNLKGNCIYIISCHVLYCFDVECRSLNITYPFSDMAFNSLPFWLLLENSPRNDKPERKLIRNEVRELTGANEKFIFDHPKFLLPTPSISSSFQHSKLCSRWHPRIPWLLFAGNGDTKCKVMDPYSKTSYEIPYPLLPGSMIFASIDGWLFAQDHNYQLFFINLFSEDRIDLPHTYHYPAVVAISAPPTSPNCKVFCISQADIEEDSMVEISIYHHGDDKWITQQTFSNEITFRLSQSNAIYLNGCFYCLGTNGNLGVYDPTKKNWRVHHTPTDIDPEPYYCTLVESCGKLLSVFLDLFENPIGVFEFDLDLWHWRTVIDMADRTFFFGNGASFCVTAASESMKNMIYFSAFEKECGLDLVKCSLASIGKVVGSSKKTTFGYMQMWLEPNMFIHGLHNPNLVLD